MFLHFLPTLGNKFSINTYPERLILPILLSGLLNGCSSQPTLHPDVEQSLHRAFGNTSTDSSPKKPALQAEVEVVLAPEKAKKNCL
jgi:hypothetical protein